MYLLEHGPGSHNGKRYNRHGVNGVVAVTTSKGNNVAAAVGGSLGSGTGNSAAS